MKKLALILALVLVPAVARAYDDPPPPPPDDGETVQPPGAPPSMQPAAPPVAPPPPQDDGNIGILGGSNDDQVGTLQTPAPAPEQYEGAPQPYPPYQAAPAPVASGQWVYTAQYGWVWMPYGSQYVNESGPCAYIFTVGFGWRWVAAPWLWGWGVRPYFGVWGPAHYAWYRGLYRPGGWGWGRYRGSPHFAGYGARYFAGVHATVGIRSGGTRYSSAPRPYNGGTRVYTAPRTYSAAPRTYSMAPRAYNGGVRVAARPNGGARTGSAPHASGGGSRHGGGGSHAGHARR